LTPLGRATQPPAVQMTRASIPLFSLLAVGCGPGIAVTGDVAGRGVDLRTAYAWLDATEVDEDDGRVVTATRERKTMHVVLSGADFDPEADVRFVPVVDRLERERTERLGGRVAFRITDFDGVGGGMLLTSERGGLMERAPRLDDLELALAERALAPDATLPAESLALASRLSMELTLTEAGRARGDSLRGTLVVKVERNDRDRQDAPTGTLTVDLDVPVIGEAIAECNASGGRASVCEPQLR
jgi:hypothetical protein